VPRTGRDQVARARDAVIARYRDGETLKALAAEYGVSDAWLKKQLTRWDVPVRDVRAARILRAQQKRNPS
jgi:Zn-dependent peptidase ImmA (M78 family)